jgi:hypothetical protein
MVAQLCEDALNKIIFFKRTYFVVGELYLDRTVIKRYVDCLTLAIRR